MTARACHANTVSQFPFASKEFNVIESVSLLSLPGGRNARKKRTKSHASCCENPESS